MARIRNRLLTALLLATLIGAQNIADLARDALQKQAAGDYAGAAAAYSELLRLDPSQVATHVNLGIVLVQLGRFDEAIHQYQEADRLLPGDPRIALNTALAYSKSGQTQEAAQRLIQLRAAAPDNRQITMLLADTQLQLGKDKEVVNLLRPLASAGDTDLGLSYMLGLALLRTGQTDEGQLQLDRILKNGDTAEAHFLLGTRMFESGDLPAAVRELAASVKINPKLAQVQSLYGRALLITGDPQGARAAFETELAANPGDFQSNAGLGQILAESRDYAKALPLLNRALALRFDSADVHLALAQCFVGTRQFSDALPHVQAAITQNQDTVEGHQLLSAIYTGLGDSAAGRREEAAAHRLRNQSEAPPHIGDVASDFELPAINSNASVKLSGFRNRQPVVLVFGSYSCPNLRSAAEALRSAYEAKRAYVQFLLVYIREAHTQASWESTRNGRDGVQVADAATPEERFAAASACSRKLHLPFTTLTDAMDGRTERAFNAWPSRAFVINRSGRITYSSRLTDLDFRPADFRQALKEVAP